MPQQKNRRLEPLKLGAQYREIEFDRATINAEERTVEVSFSSETPVERWWGVETLDHGPKSVRLGRLNAGAAVLVNHNPNDHVGAVQKGSARVDASSRKGRATVRFGRSARAQEIFQDVQDNIRNGTSIGYKIKKLVLEEEKQGELPKYRATDWEPLEISFASVPADTAVGVGRADGTEDIEVELLREEHPMPPDEGTAAQTPAIVPTPPQAPSQEADIRAIREAERNAERQRVKDIDAIGSRFESLGGPAMARESINAGHSLEQFRERILGRLQESGAMKPIPDVQIGMKNNEIQRYSIVRLIRHLTDPGNQKFRNEAAFELECADAFTQKIGTQPRGVYVPPDVLNRWGEQRIMQTGTGTIGGYIVGTDLLAANFIEMLRNNAPTMQMATVLSGLVGQVNIPKQTGAATAYWIAEGSAITTGDLVLGVLALSPKTVGAAVPMTRSLLMQSTPDIEGIVRNDVAQQLGIAIDAAAINGAGGTDNNPVGILKTSGIGTTTAGSNGGTCTWSIAVGLETLLGNNNALAGGLAYLTNSKVRGSLKTIAKGSNLDFIWNTNSPGTPLNGYPVTITNNVPSNGTKGTSSGICSSLIFGNWPELIFGLWGGLDIVPDRATLVSSGGMIIWAFQSCDLGVRHAASFSAVLDLLT